MNFLASHFSLIFLAPGNFQHVGIKNVSENAIKIQNASETKHSVIRP